MSFTSTKNVFARKSSKVAQNKPAMDRATSRPVDNTHSEEHLGWYLCQRQSVCWDPSQFTEFRAATPSSEVEQALNEVANAPAESPAASQEPFNLPRTSSLGKRSHQDLLEAIREQSDSNKRLKVNHENNEQKAETVDVEVELKFQPGDIVKIRSGAQKKFLGKIARVEKYLVSKEKYGLVLGKNKRIMLAEDCLVKMRKKAKVQFSQVASSITPAGSDAIRHFGKNIWKCKNGTALMKAAIAQNRLDIVKAMVVRGKCDISSVDSHGRSALHLAAMNRNTKCAFLLLEMGIDANIQDETGKTALMYAGMHGMTDLVEILVGGIANTNVTCQDEDGWTALMFAAKKGCMKMTNILVNNGANLEAENDTHRNALMVALEFGHHHVAERLMVALHESEKAPAKFERVNTNTLLTLVA